MNPLTTYGATWDEIGKDFAHAAIVLKQAAEAGRPFSLLDYNPTGTILPGVVINPQALPPEFGGPQAGEYVVTPALDGDFLRIRNAAFEVAIETGKDSKFVTAWPFSRFYMVKRSGYWIIAEKGK